MACAAQRRKFIGQDKAKILRGVNDQAIPTIDNRESQGHMLIFVIRLHLEWQRLAIHFHRNNLRAQAECGRELHPAISVSSPCYIESNAVSKLVKFKIHADRS